MTESRKPSCPETDGSISAMASATRQTDDVPSSRRPASVPAESTADMAHARTAEAGAPHRATKSSVTTSCAARRPLGPIPVCSSALARIAPTTAMWLPETATRWATPHVANSLSSPLSRISVRSPKTMPASTARSSDSSGQRYDRAASRAASGSAPMPRRLPRNCSLTRVTVPQTPCWRFARP